MTDLFERPVQTIKGVSTITRISRTTILKACQSGRMGDCAYRSGDAWLIDTACQQFLEWLGAYPNQRRVKGRLARQVTEEKEHDG